MATMKRPRLESVQALADYRLQLVFRDGSVYTVSLANSFDKFPGLGPLQDNSGPTWSYQPMFASPLINSGAMDGCRDAANTMLNVDQRGLQRPRDGRCDLGALETDNLVTAVLYMPTLWR